MDVWDAAVRFLLVGDRARQLAMRHPLANGICSQCEVRRCTAARMAAEALLILRRNGSAGAAEVDASILAFPSRGTLPR